MLNLRTLKVFNLFKTRLTYSTLTSHEYISQLKDSLQARGRLDLLKEIQTKDLSQYDKHSFPNLIHPEVLQYGDKPKVLEEYNSSNRGSDDKSTFTFHDICQKLNLLRMDTGQFAGSKSYFLMDDLAHLENSLILYAVDRLRSKGFELISVPDILPARNIEACGMKVFGERNQVYKLSGDTNGNVLCLSGTSEMALATYLSNRCFRRNELPKKLMSVSRCFRAETSSVHEEKGIFRVHQFNKVEMFGVCTPEKSDEFLEEFRSIQTSLFKDLGLQFMILDMPPHELGDPAYRKYDIESWMPGRKMYGEISSCSNCTDYQSSRLNITVKDEDDVTKKFVHTINGTAAAIPRLLIAILESFQQPEGYIEIPKVLQKYFNSNRISRKKLLPDIKLVKDIPKQAIFKA